MKARSFAVLMLTFTCSFFALPAFGQLPPLNVQVPEPPHVLSAHAGAYLVYEAYVTNLSGRELTLDAIEVRDADALLTATPYLRLAGADLAEDMQRFGDPGVTDANMLPAGRTSIAFLWLALPSATSAPRSLIHRFSIHVAPVSGQTDPETLTVDGVVVPVTAHRSQPIGKPLRGDHWLAANGPDNTSSHRRALVAFHGQAHSAERYAIDWVRLYDDGRTFHGDPAQNSSYRAYGEPVLAVTSGSVVEIVDGIPENTPGAPAYAVPITPATVGGNYVLLDMGAGRHAFYAHLQPGSLAVRRGDAVRRGQVLGLLGNSGNSTEPHLHFHVSDRNSALDSEGVPYAFAGFVLEVSGDQITPSLVPDSNSLRIGDDGLAKWRGSRPEQRTRDIPLQNAIVSFAD